MINGKKSIIIDTCYNGSVYRQVLMGSAIIRSGEGMYDSKRKTFLFLKNRKVFEELKYSTSFYKQRGIKEYFARNN